MVNEILLEKFKEVFKVPQFVGDYLKEFVTAEEIKLVVLLGKEAKSAAQVAAGLGLSIDETEELVENSFKRFLLERESRDDERFYRITDFYTRLDKFAMFEDYAKLPVEVKKALDKWCFEQYLVFIKPLVGRFTAGTENNQFPHRSKPELVGAYSGFFHSPMDIQQAFQLIDLACQIVLVPCDCRSLSERCDQPTQTCMHFDREAEKFTSRGLGKRLTKEEAKELVLWTDKKGLMHCGNRDYLENGPAFICNCDLCCCYPFRAGQFLATLSDWPILTNQAVYDADKCSHCGVCVKRCYFQAFYLMEDKNVAFAAGKCQGCGLCVTTCPKKAIEMRVLS